MQTTLLAWRIFARRGLANWRMLSVLALGVLVTAILLAAAPIYTRAMSDLGLSFSIAQDLEGRSGVRADVPEIPIAGAGGPELRGAIDARVAERTSWFGRETVVRAVAGRFFMAQPGEAPKAAAPFIQPQSLTRVTKRTSACWRVSFRGIAAPTSRSNSPSPGLPPTRLA